MVIRHSLGLFFLLGLLFLDSVAYADRQDDAQGLATPQEAIEASLVPPSVQIAPPQPPAPATRPSLPPNFFVAPRQDEPLERAAQHRNTGISLVVIGHLLQFAGVSLLVPAVWHQSAHDSFPVLRLAIGGGALVGVGNVVEGFGWSFIIRSSIERERLRRQGIQLVPISTTPDPPH